MTQAEALRLAAYLAGAYRNSDSSDGALAVLADQFLDLDHERARTVVRGVVAAGGAFAPSPGELRAAYFASVHRLPSVATIVNEIAAARSKPIADAVFSHPLIREVALEVGYAKIREDWAFAHREVRDAADRLHAEFLRSVNVASLTGRQPDLTGNLALIARGLDFYEKPPIPQLEAGWKWGGWSLDDGKWAGTATGPNKHHDVAWYECPMLYEGMDEASMPPALGSGAALKALPAGGWTPPQARRTRYDTKALSDERHRAEMAKIDADWKAREEWKAKRAVVEKMIQADPEKFKAMNAIERSAYVQKLVSEVVLPTPSTKE